jgi:prolipoprotein diacylglyceryl transferase
MCAVFMFGYLTLSPDPVIVQLGPLALRWYGLLIAAGFLVGYFVVQRMFRREGRSEDTLQTLLLYIMAGTIIGARLGHVLLYEPGYYFSHPWKIVAVWEGGLASHGGTLGVMLAVWWYCRQHPDQPLLWLWDRLVVPTAFVAACIRTGNVFNSEILGHPTEVPWAVVFARVDALPRHPSQMYEAAAYLLLFAVLLALYIRMGARTPRGLLTGLFFAGVFTARFLIEFTKERQEAYVLPVPLNTGQLLSLPFIVFGLVLCWRAWRASETPGSAKERKP